ncbi:hypothetical protein P154DRAFT_403800, partial [Amniculicola lignicola CBS 123094]
WTTSTSLVRISMGLLYIRLFPTRTFIIVCWIFILEHVACILATFIAVPLICQPMAFHWDKTIAGGHCGDLKKFYLWNGLQNLVSDVAIIVLPMSVLWKLQLPWSKRVSLSLVFGVGVVICIITMVRSIELARLSAIENTHDYATIGILSILEPLLGIVNCTLPLLRPIVVKVQ